MNLNKSKTKKSEIFRLVYNAARATNNTIRFRLDIGSGVPRCLRTH